jgi:hypothetical protein
MFFRIFATKPGKKWFHTNLDELQNYVSLIIGFSPCQYPLSVIGADLLSVPSKIIS